MSRNTTILVPIDGSTSATRALEFALGRIRDGGRIVALNVQPPLPPSRLVPRSMIDEHHRRESTKALRAARRIAKRHRIDIDWQVLVGPAAPTIVQCAQDKRCGEIVMGTRGLGRLPGFVLGSTAMRVVQLADVPVTLVK